MCAAAHQHWLLRHLVWLVHELLLLLRMLVPHARARAAAGRMRMRLTRGLDGCATTRHAHHMPHEGVHCFCIT
jgi:hypothetical protein